MSREVDELLVVLKDARLSGNAAAVQRLGAEVAERLGVSEVGADEFGLWLRFEVGSVSHRMRWCWPGRFLMGSPEDEPGRYGDEVQHKVVLTTGFWLGETPVTNALWVAVMGHNPSNYAGPQRPVETVSWEEAQRFCARLTQLHSGLHPRLPTEAQWEYAARAGTTTPHYGVVDEVAWYAGNSDGETHPVGLKQPSDWGIFDMLGNVYEWCADHTNLVRYETAEQRDPQNTEGSLRVIRGGSWSDDARYVRAAYRSAYEPDIQDTGLGFRLAGGPALRTRSGARASGAEGGGADCGE